MFKGWLTFTTSHNLPRRAFPTVMPSSRTVLRTRTSRKGKRAPGEGFIPRGCSTEQSVLGLIKGGEPERTEAAVVNSAGWAPGTNKLNTRVASHPKHVLAHATKDVPSG